MAVLTNFVKPGDKVDIMKIKGSTTASLEDERRNLRSKVYDIISDDELKLEMPMEKGRLILLPVGEEYDICFYTSSGLYQCTAVVRERYKSNNVFVLNMELTGSLRKFQRREYYRLNCVLDMKCTCVEEDKIEDLHKSVEFIENELTLQDGTIVDISGGGVRFLSSQQYDKGTLILFVFELDLQGRRVPYRLVGKILMSEELETRRGQFENRVQFLNMAADDREGIIRYIFEEERKIRRKEKY